MAGYSDGEALIAALVQAISGYSASNVTRGNWRPLNTGKAAKYAILKPGASEDRKFDSPTRVTEHWTTIVQLWHAYGKDGETLLALEADVEAVLSKIDQYPRLNQAANVDYVMGSNAVRVGEALEMWTKGGGPQWLRQDITIEWMGKRIRSYS
jgi:hypothetical protein